MHSQPSERLPNRPDFYGSYYSDSSSLWDRLRQPSIIVPLGLLLFTVFYQSLHSSSQLSHVRHPGELLWDFVVTITPARLLYALDRWLNPPAFPLPDDMLPPQSTSYAAKGELLRRIIGIDRPGSIMNAVTLAGKKGMSSLSQVALAKPRRINDQPPGLGNYDNSCFQNSILQGLCSLRSFPAYLASALEDEKHRGNRSEASSTATLFTLLRNLADPQNNGTTLWTPGKLKSLDTWQQQDAQEYYSKILDEIDKEVMRAAQAQNRTPGLEVAGIRDDTVDSQHSDDSGYQSLSTLSKPTNEGRILKNPLEGLVAQRVACVQCGHSEGLSMIPFNCITLSLGVGQGFRDLFERLDSYTDLESIEGVECAKCTLLKAERLLNIIVARSREAGLPQETLKEPLARLEAVKSALEEEDFEEQTLLDKCKISRQNRVSSTKTKQMVIGRPPSNLAIHFNRSVFDDITGHMFKNLAAVRFPSILDLGPWCLGSGSGYTVKNDVGPGDDDSSSRPVHHAEEHWSADPTCSMIAGDLQPSRLSGPIYELRAVITHQGRHENGHYVCYRKHPLEAVPTEEDAGEKSGPSVVGQAEKEGGQQNSEQDNAGECPKWWRLSDEAVREVSEEVVLAQGGVFMLFYECVDPNSVLVSSDQGGTPLALANNDKGGVPEEAKAGAKPESFMSNNQSHDKNSYELKACEKPETIMSQSYGSSDSALHKTYASSSLLPLLDENEDVEPTIPLRWPNS